MGLTPQTPHIYMRFPSVIPKWFSYSRRDPVAPFRGTILYDKAYYPPYGASSAPCGESSHLHLVSIPAATASALRTVEKVEFMYQTVREVINIKHICSTVRGLDMGGNMLIRCGSTKYKCSTHVDQELETSTRSQVRGDRTSHTVVWSGAGTRQMSQLIRRLTRWSRWCEKGTE